MKHIAVKIVSSDVLIDKDVFMLLFKDNRGNNYSTYKQAILENYIRYDELKKLAIKAGIPFPLLFAPRKKVLRQIEYNKEMLLSKLPSKREIAYSFRGAVELKDIELIAKDLSRKQEFLKNKVNLLTLDNQFIGYIAKQLKQRRSIVEIADNFREYFNIDLEVLRRKNMVDILDALVESVERKNILISFNSWNFMPQNIEKDINMSGFCIKDRKYPYIFINTKESNQENTIVEPIGRQIFSLIFLLCYIGLNDYLLASGRVNRHYVNYNKIYSIAAEVLLPEREIADIKISNLEQIRRYASIFKVTPSMFVMRCLNSGRIGKAAANEYFESLKSDFLLSKRKSQGRYNPISGFSKYNGKKLSHDVVLAYREKRISYDETCNVLFMNRKSMGKDLVGEYVSRFG